jgi:hypothetical protein
MSSKRFGKKTKKPKDKAEKKKSEAALAGDKNSRQATKAASYQSKHFQRRTSG